MGTVPLWHCPASLADVISLLTKRAKCRSPVLACRSTGAVQLVSHLLLYSVAPFLPVVGLPHAKLLTANCYHHAAPQITFSVMGKVSFRIGYDNSSILGEYPHWTAVW